jgi:hypothetical protein
MSDLFRAMAFDDDIGPVFDAFSEWCKQHKVSPDSLEGCRAASHFFDLFQNGCRSKNALLLAVESRSIPLSHGRAA